MSPLRAVLLGPLLLLLAAPLVQDGAAVRLEPVLSGSMGDAHPAGSLAVLVRTPGEDVRPGDVLAFSPGGDHGSLRVLHRVTEVRDGRARTRGDANEVPDPWQVPLAENAYRATASVPVLGRVVVAGREVDRGPAASLVGGVLLMAWGVRARPTGSGTLA